MEFHGGTQLEGVLLSSRSGVRNGPTFSESWQYRPIGTVAHKALVQPVIGEELIRIVALFFVKMKWKIL